MPNVNRDIYYTDSNCFCF